MGFEILIPLGWLHLNCLPANHAVAKTYIYTRCKRMRNCEEDVDVNDVGARRRSSFTSKSYPYTCGTSGEWSRYKILRRNGSSCSKWRVIRGGTFFHPGFIEGVVQHTMESKMT